MTRLDSIRKNGLIPERRHDAFLLALLLAVGLNVAVFLAQALLPHLAALLQSLGVMPPVVQEEDIPFVLVDPSLFDEEVTPDDAAATAAISREARQEEEAPVEADEVFRPEGVDELLALDQGNQGEIDPGVDSAGLPALEEIGEEENVEAEEPVEPVEELPEPVEEAPEPIEPVEEIPEPVEEIPEPAEEIPEPVVEPEVLPPPEPPEIEIEEIEPVAEPLPLPPQPEEVPVPVVLPEVAPEPPPEPVELPPEPVPQVVEPTVEPLPEVDPVVAPAEVIDLAMLPVRDEGLFDPEREAVRDRAQQAPPIAAPAPDQFEVSEYFQPEMRPEQIYQPPQAVQPVQPNRPVRPPPRDRTNSRPPPSRVIGGASTAGGAPPRRDMAGRRVDLFGDPYMELLRSLFPEYMAKLTTLLQESLNRTMILHPGYRVSGRARLQFSLSDQGEVAGFRTVDSSDSTIRVISETTLLEGGPFGPPPPAMMAHPAFQGMTMNVYIY